MNIYTFASLLAFGFCSFLSGFVIFSSKERTPQKKYFSLVTFFIGIWCLFPFLLSISGTDKTAVIYSRLVYIFASFVPATFFHFMLFSTGTIHRERETKVLFSSYIISAVFLVVINTPFFIKGTVRFRPDFAVVPGVMYFFFILYFSFMYVWGTYCLIYAYKRAKELAREKLRYIGLAFALAFPSGLMHFASAYGIKEIFPHDFLVIIYTSLIAYAIVKHRLMDIRTAVTNAGIFLFVYTLVLGLPFWVGYETQKWIIPTFFMFVLATIGPLIYRFLQKRAQNLLLAQQKHYQRVLLQAAGGMTREHDLGKLLKIIVYIVKRAVKIDFAGIFLEDKESNCYRLRAVRDQDTFPANFSFPHNHPLIKAVRKKKTILTYEEISPLLAEIYEPAPHLIVPSFMEDRLMGFLVLGEKENHSLYTDDDINVFKILSYHAALAIENCLFFEEFKKANEKIFVAEKLASIGGMADGVAHQMKNRLNHFSVASGELQFEIKDFMKEHSQFVKDNPFLKKSLTYLTKIANSLVANVKRTDDIIKGILNYARTSQKDTFFSEFSFKEVVDLSLDLLKVKHEIAQFPLDVDLGKNERVYGVKSQIMETFYNILDNGYEAIQEKRAFLAQEDPDAAFKGQIKVTLHKRGGNALIEIMDNGIGIKEEDQAKIFAPFFTTKSSYKSGTGIGMYVVKRMVEENHHGRVWFRSKYKEGTKFYIRLPDKGFKS